MAILTRSNQWICLLVFSLVILVHSIRTDASVPTFILKSAVDEGAVCLDGSPPAYNWDAGKGEGARNWLLHLQGGGWCLNSTLYQTFDYSVQHCASRVYAYLGSSLHMPATENLTGILSSDPKNNAFYNWNRVFIRYCDGGSFVGDVEQPDPVTKHYYRGARIFNAVVKDLLAKGMKDAKNVLLSGGSAGGLGSIIHCDRFRALFSKNKPDKALPAECTSKMSPFECFFPKSLVQYVKSPMYFLNSAFDSFQIRNTFSEDLRDAIKNHTVSPSDVPMLKDFRQQLLSVLPPSSDKGFVITSLFGHTFSLTGLKKPMFVDKKSETFESALMDWFFDQRSVKKIDPTEVPVYVQR
nr:pectin acetylesterase 8-like [Ipomoea batatas]